jgi:hypothetical protein
MPTLGLKSAIIFYEWSYPLTKKNLKRARAEVGGHQIRKSVATLARFTEAGIVCFWQVSHNWVVAGAWVHYHGKGRRGRSRRWGRGAAAQPPPPPPSPAAADEDEACLTTAERMPSPWRPRWPVGGAAGAREFACSGPDRPSVASVPLCLSPRRHTGAREVAPRHTDHGRHTRTLDLGRTARVWCFRMGRRGLGCCLSRCDVFVNFFYIFSWFSK